MALSKLIVRYIRVCLPFALVLENYVNYTNPISPTDEISFEIHLRLIKLISTLEQAMKAQRGSTLSLTSPLDRVGG
jgi:hypothetical protein